MKASSSQLSSASKTTEEMDERNRSSKLQAHGPRWFNNGLLMPNDLMLVGRSVDDAQDQYAPKT